MLYHDEELGKTSYIPVGMCKSSDVAFYRSESLSSMPAIL